MQSLKTSKSRENILKKIRSGVAAEKLPMPFPSAEHAKYEDVFASSNLSDEELFASEFIKLGGKFIFCGDESEMIEQMLLLQDQRGWQEVLCAENSLMEQLQQHKMPFLFPADKKYSGADACITYCDGMVARTGSFLFSSKLPMGRVAPVFYPVHIVVAYHHQLKRDIGDGLKDLVTSGSLPSMINLNTGPSRTADIEKTLVVGVHGPAEVFCFFIAN